MLKAGESFCIEFDGLTLLSTCGGAPCARVTIEPSIPVSLASADRFWRLSVGLEMLPRPAVPAH
jgi:hypothetical protein